MRNSWKLGAYIAFGSSLAFIGCGDDNGSDDDNGGKNSGGASAGKGGGGGTPSGGSGAGKGGSGGTPSGGSSAGKGGGAGTAGSGGSAPEGGSGSEGGSGQGLGGEGMGGAGDCIEDELGLGGAGGDTGAGGGGGAGSDYTTATVLIDNVVVKSAAAANVEAWSFANADDISDSTASNVGGKWLRPLFGDIGVQDPNNISYAAGAHNLFAKCDGKPAGSMKALVPFTAAAQYFEIHNGFAQVDWHDHTITADVKLVSGGAPESACPGHALLFINGASGITDGTSKLLIEGEWVTIELTVPTASTMTDRLGVRFTSYVCL